jgi:predicted Zn-dependent protease
VAPILDRAMSRIMAENGIGPFADRDRPGFSKIGQQIIDRRLTLSADPMDPECGFVPFDWNGEPYLATNWIEHGVLKELYYPRSYGLRQMGKDYALPNSRAFRLSGGTTTIDEMIADTRRGILVTRFNNLQILDLSSMLLQGNTRDGLWLIEKGKITKAIKNFRVTESPLFVLNSLQALGVPQRVYRPAAPAVCPPIMAQDFSFTGLMDAV